jgi:hypothetical protein
MEPSFVYRRGAYLAANCVAASKQETKMRETPKGGFSPHLNMNTTPTETSINPEHSVIMPKETVVKTRIRLPTKRGWAAMKVADLFKAQKTLRELCRDHGAPLHLARHYLYQNKTK